MQHVIGIDVSKLKLDICALFDGKMKKKIFDNNEIGFKQLQGWISKLKLENPHICMESNGCYSEGVADFFHNQNFLVSMVNPLQIKGFRSCRLVRQKTDSSDSEIIAMFCLQNNPAPYTPKTNEQRALHDIVLLMDSLKAEIMRLRNLLEKNQPAIVLQVIQESLEFHKKSLKTLELELHEIVRNNKELNEKFNLLTDITGVGDKTAILLISEMPDVSMFKNAAQYAAFTGVIPAHFQSGSSVRGRSHISKIGSKRLRNVLYMSALSVKLHNVHFQKFVRKLLAKGKAQKVIIVAIMRKLMYIFFGMLKNLQKFNHNLAFHN